MHTVRASTISLCLAVVAAAGQVPAAQTVASTDFEDATLAARLIEAPSLVAVPGGGQVLQGDSRASDATWNEYGKSVTGLFGAREAYTVTFDCRVVELAPGAEAYALFRRPGGATRGWLTFPAGIGQLQHLSLGLWTAHDDDWQLILGIKGRGLVQIDNLLVSTDPAERVPELTMPNPNRTWRSPGRTTYYIDSRRGNDAQSGTSRQAPWRSLAKVNSGVFAAGDQIRLTAGGEWGEFLAPGGQGSKAAPLVVGVYGSGPRPKIDCGGAWQATLYLHNTQYVVVEGLAISNHGPREHPGRTGVTVSLKDYGVARDIVLRDLEVTDVNGSNVKAEGGGTGISITRTQSDGGKVRSKYEGLRIENCHLVRCDRNGIGFGGYWGRHEWNANLGVVVKGNLLEDIGGDGIVPVGCDGAVIERNVLRGGRMRADDYAAGIWPWSCDNTLIQFNEVSGMRGTRDGQGFDSDWNCQNSVFQYNYSHDNDGGFMLICNDGGVQMPYSVGNVGTIVRYNISQNDGERIIDMPGPSRQTLIANNVFFVGPERDVPLVQGGNWGGDWPEDTRFCNNIVYVAGRTHLALGEMRATQWLNNVFFGAFDGAPQGAGNQRHDPLLVRPGSGGDGLASLGGYRLQPGSPCHGAGLNLRLAGSRDFWGNPLPSTDPPAIGCHQPPH